MAGGQLGAQYFETRGSLTRHQGFDQSHCDLEVGHPEHCGHGRVVDVVSGERAQLIEQ